MAGDRKPAGGCDLWLWDGGSEYEGVLVRLEENAFAARVRQARKGPGGTLGKRLAATGLDLQKQFHKRRFLAHLKGAADGTLFEASIESVQGSADGEFDYLVAGRFSELDEPQLEVLRRMSSGHAADRFQRPAG